MKHVLQFLLLTVTLSLSVQFIGCTSAEVTSAKLYRSQRNNEKAKELLEKAIKSNPTDDEAWTLYVQTLYDLKEYERIAEVIDTARLYAVTHRADVDGVRYNTWVELYNGGVQAYGMNPDDPEQRRAAIQYLEAAQRLMPEQPETYEILGQVYYAAEQTDKAMQTLSQAINQSAASHDQGLALGLTLKMSPDAVEKAVGAPSRRQMIALGDKDSAMVFAYPDQQRYIYFEREARGQRRWQLTGWRFTADERTGLQLVRVSTNPFLTVANHYYSEGVAAHEKNNMQKATENFDKALPVLLKLQRLDPSDEWVMERIPEIYTKLNRVPMAKQQYEKLLQEQPTKNMYTAYGSLLLKTEDYQGAIAAYEGALKLDPQYEPALYNIAASYKNWAAAVQAQMKTNKSIKEAEVLDKLARSTGYFERFHAMKPTDMNIVSQLLDNYQLSKQKDKEAMLLKEMEAMKSNSDVANDPAYWEAMGKLYSKSNPKEAENAFKKADQLRR